MIACKKCILDSNDDPKLVLDDEGVCNYCRYYDGQAKKHIRTGEEGARLFTETINKIKEYGKGKKYDCLVGLSGGVDSSYVAYLAKKHGLRPLCVHFDNGWNSELAVVNIQNVVTKCDWDLHNYVIDWEEFKSMQIAYLKASVIDIEVLTDHAIYASIYRIVKDYKIKYILGGHNIVTEAILPPHWTHKKSDYLNIKDIYRQYGTIKLRSYPFLDRKMKKYIKRSGVEFIDYLNWVPYVKNDVKEILKKELGWRDYGGKHFESI